MNCVNWITANIFELIGAISVVLSALFFINKKFKNKKRNKEKNKIMNFIRNNNINSFDINTLLEKLYNNDKTKELIVRDVCYELLLKGIIVKNSITGKDENWDGQSYLVF